MPRRDITKSKYIEIPSYYDMTAGELCTLYRMAEYGEICEAIMCAYRHGFRSGRRAEKRTPTPVGKTDPTRAAGALHVKEKKDDRHSK